MTNILINIRHVEPDDYRQIIINLNEWWGGRSMSDMLPKLFFVHFRSTSFIAEYKQEIVGFLSGFLSQTYSDETYVHFIGVHPQFRQQNIGKMLYNSFFKAIALQNRNIIRCVTSPVNKTSITVHRRLGFAIEPGNLEIDGVSVHQNYDGNGEDRVLLFKKLLG